MLKLAIIGFGGLGKSHFNNVIKLQKSRDDIKLAAIFDVDKSRFTSTVKTNIGDQDTTLDLSDYTLYQDIDVLLEKEDLDFVITALPTYLHAEIAIKCLDKGIHVFSEKPMALNLDQCQAMVDASIRNNKKLMIGQCLRYWPAYMELKNYIDTKKFGKVIRGEFARYSATPIWTWENWMLDFEKSGGAALDLHVHDVDFIQYTFGLPKAISSRASHEVNDFDSINSTYWYDNMYINCSSDWGMASSFPFSASFLVRFEDASVKFDGDGLKVYPHNNGEVYIVELSEKSAYVSEIEDFISNILTDTKSTVNPPESNLLSIKMALLEMESARKGEVVHV